MKYAVAYARVSTEDQARRNLSVPAQFRRIEEYAERNSIQIVYRDADEGVSAYKDNENRDAFWRCVERACKDKRVTLFLIDDPLRFFRDRYMAVETKAELRRAGVRVLVVSNPYDTNTIQGVWQEAIDEARAQTGSMETAFATFRGMEQNARTRDPETGWCYKNGGRAPFGYRAVHVVRGQDSRGRDIVKTLWEIDPEAGEVLRFMYVTCRAEKEMSYDAIQRALNSAGMLSPTPGRPWTISSIIEMMREDRVLQNAGVYFWNKEDHRTPGRRFKDKSEWIRIDNAHPAIITMEEAERVIALKNARRTDHVSRRADSSPYLLTGKNLMGDDMFVCLACGSRMTSLRPGKRYRACYVCGNVRYRGHQACIYKPVDKEWVEGFLLEKIGETFGNPEAARRVADQVNESIGDELEVRAKARNKLLKALDTIEAKITNLVRAVADGFDVGVAKKELEALQAEKTQTEAMLRELDGEEGIKPKPVTASDVLELYRNLEKAFQSQDNAAKRKMLRYFVRRLEFDPGSDTLTVYFFAEPAVASICQSYGARSGARYVCHNASRQRMHMNGKPGPHQRTQSKPKAYSSTSNKSSTLHFSALANLNATLTRGSGN